VNTFTFVSFKAEQTRQRIIDRALELFAGKGYRETTLADIAAAAGVATGLAYRYFRRKEELVLSLYEQLSDEVAERLRLPEGTVGARWAALERMRFSVLGPHRRTLLALAQAALDPEGELGALSPATAHVRATWLRLHRDVVAGAAHCPANPEQLARVLYAVDLALVLLWTQDRSGKTTRAAIDRFAALIDGLVPLLALPVAGNALAEMGAVFQSLIKEKPDES
jgi:AcrR family transcriptional regulator